MQIYSIRFHEHRRRTLDNGRTNERTNERTNYASVLWLVAACHERVTSVLSSVRWRDGDGDGLVVPGLG